MDHRTIPLYAAPRLKVNNQGKSLESISGIDFNRIPIIRDEGAINRNKDFNIFKGFATNGDMWSYIESFPVHERTFHETILGDLPQRLRFDIDTDLKKKKFIDNYMVEPLETYKPNLANHDIIIQYLRDLIYNKFIEIYSKVIKKDRPNYTLDKDQLMLVTESHGEDKYSYHIIITKFMVKNNLECKWFFNEVIKDLRAVHPEFVDIFDGGIYKPTQFFRFTECCKASDRTRPKILSEINMNVTKNLDRGVIQHNYPGDDFIISTTNYEIVSRICENLPDSNLSEIPNDIEQRCKDILDKMFTSFRFKCTKGNIMEYTRIESSYCTMCRRLHEQENAFAYIKQGNLYWHCRRGSNHMQIAAIDEYKFNQFDNMCITKDTILGIPLDDIEPLKIYHDNPLFNQEDDSWVEQKRDIEKSSELKDFQRKYDTLFVKAPMKMGKSKYLIKHLRELHEEVNSILVISFRRAFTEEFLSKFNTGDKRTGLDIVYGGKLEDYRDFTGNITSDIHPYMMVQVDSFHRVKTKYHTVILDESESIYDQFSSSNIDNLSLIVSNFTKVLKRAERVICMDAYMDIRTVELTNKIRGENKKNIKFYINKFQNQGVKSKNGQYTYNVGYCANNFYERIRSALEQNKKIVIISNIRDKLIAYERMISRHFPNINIQSYTSMTNTTDKKDLQNVNSSWLQYNVVMYSPTITAGISFEEKHFDQVYCFFSNMSCNVLACMQMIGRIRDVADKNITICLENQYNRCSVTKEGIEQDLINGRHELLSLKYTGGTDMEHDAVDEEIFQYKPYKDTYYYIWLYNQLSSNKSKKFFLRNLIYCIHVTGAKIVLYDTVEGEGKKQRNVVLREIKYERYSKIASVDLPTREKLEEIFKKAEIMNISFEEQCSLEKLRMKNTYKVKNDHVLHNEDFISDYYPKQVRYKWSNLNSILKFKTMEEGIKDLCEYECSQIGKFIDNGDSKSDLNFMTKSLLHNSILEIIKLCGYEHILDEKTVNKIDLEKKLQKKLPFIQQQLKKHGLRNIYIKYHKDKNPAEAYFIAVVEAINNVLNNFYGISLKGTNKFSLVNKTKFTIVKDDKSKDSITDLKPYIWYVGYVKSGVFTTLKYVHPGLILQVEDHVMFDYFIDDSIEEEDDLEEEENAL